MNRLERLELVVRNLADRILGEEYTFDAIAEQEAAEQGVAYVAPEPTAQALDLSPIFEAIEDLSRRIAMLESRPVAQKTPGVDLAPIDGLTQRVLDLETETQRILQRQEDDRATLNAHRNELDVITTVPVFEIEARKLKVG